MLSAFKAPDYFFSQLKSIITRFLWAKGAKKGIYWRSWSYLCKPISEGGLGFRDLKAQNQSLLAKTADRIRLNPSSLLARALLGKYCTRQTFLEVACKPSASWGWKGVIWGRDLLNQGLIWSVGNGESINPFKDNWVPHCDTTLAGNLVEFYPSITVKNFFVGTPRSWNVPLLNCFFPCTTVEKIEQIFIPVTDQPDSLFWPFEKTGSYSVRSGHHLVVASRMQTNQRSMSEAALIIWKKYLKLKLLPSFRAFLWRFLSCCLPVMTTLLKRNVPISSPVCSRCKDDVEDLGHCFFGCPDSRAIWFGSSLGLRYTSSQILNPFEFFLHTISATQSEEDHLLILTILRQIWLHRNSACMDLKPKKPEVSLAAISFSFHQLLGRTQHHQLPIASTTPELNPSEVNPMDCFFKGGSNSSPSIFVVDATWKPNRPSTAAWVDQKDHSIAACCSFSTSSAAEAEARGINNALKWLLDNGYSDIELWTDSRNTVRNINGHVNHPPLQPLFADIRHACSLFHYICIKFVGRKLVAAAHTKAREHAHDVLTTLHIS